jgi:CheY-like chemotaxis protein
MLGHELRNPIAPMVNAVHLLGRPGEGQRAREILERQLEQLTRLVDDLLDVSRVSRGKIELRRELLDLSQLVRGVAEDHLEHFRSRGVQLHVDCAESVWVDGDRVRLQQIAGNLLGNALEFTPAHGRVAVKVERAFADARLTVTDTGEGLDAATLRGLFQPFVQARRPGGALGPGLGLGLAVVRGIAELHGGQASAASAGLGQGSTFEVNLPAVEAPVQVAAVERPAEAEGRRPLSVLVIDDNVDLANSMRDLLAFEAEQVAVENSGAAAVATIRRLKPHLVICDIGLPGKDGYAIAAEVRADPALASVKLVALSGYGLAHDKQRAAQAGFSLHLTKPVRPDALMRLLDDAS